MASIFESLYRRLGARYLLIFLAVDTFSAPLICAGTIGIFSLYQHITLEDFWRVLVFAELFVAAGLAYGFLKARRIAEPLSSWLKEGKSQAGALEAWRTAVSLPREWVVQNGWHPFVIVAVPIALYFTLSLHLPFYSAGIIFAGTVVAIAYGAVLHFFTAEQLLRPVVEDICSHLPLGFAGQPAGVPLRWKLLGALPLINVITGVVVSGLSTNGQASLQDLGVDVVVAVAVAFTLSLELTVLVTKSVLRPVEDLVAATQRVRVGDLSARVPVVSGDELGTLAGSFNQMMEGLSEREALREAFGSYVDPEVAERILEEGEMLDGQDVEVTIAFIDVRDFTAFADRSSAAETVAFLNEFFGLVVPIVLQHKGHANKFMGDGLLAVFGAPERLSDHPDRALTASCEIAREVERHFEGEVRIGVGVNSGPVIAGSMGGGGRLEFAVIGDPVNVAARVQAATRDTGDMILLTEATRCLLERTGVDLEPRGEVPLRGKSDPVPVYAAPVLDERTRAPLPRLTAEA